MMAETRPRIAGVLVGDIVHDAGNRTKYGVLFQELSRRLDLVEVRDAGLRGPARWTNALRVFHPSRQRWRERFFKNVPAFAARSRRTGAWLRGMSPGVEAVLQVGALLDARGWAQGPPSVIYTDYTALLSARKPEAGRSAFSGSELKRWVELEGRAYQRAESVCVRSRRVASSLAADYGVPEHKIAVVGGGVNFAELPAPRPRPERADPVALFIGKDFHRKGGDILLRAFALARRQTPQARLRVVTAGPIPSDLPMLGVEVISPTWDRKAIAALYQEADLFVLPSRLETWGDVLLEAMAYGLPCIGVSGDAMDEIIEHEATGLVAEPEDVDSLAAALSRLLAGSELRADLGRRALERVEREFTWRRVVDRLLPWIERAARGTTSAGHT